MFYLLWFIVDVEHVLNDNGWNMRYNGWNMRYNGWNMRCRVRVGFEAGLQFRFRVRVKDSPS